MASREPAVTLRFPLIVSTPKVYECRPENSSYPKDRRLIGCSAYGDGPAARKKIREKIAQHVDRALDTEANHAAVRLIGCQDGTALLVRWSHGGWGYEMHGPERRGVCSCSGRDTLDATVEDAVRHARQSFGGIAWTSPQGMVEVDS